MMHIPTSNLILPKTQTTCRKQTPQLLIALQQLLFGIGENVLPAILDFASFTMKRVFFRFGHTMINGTVNMLESATGQAAGSFRLRNHFFDEDDDNLLLKNYDNILLGQSHLQRSK